MYACTFKLDGADYQLKAGDVVEVSSGRLPDRLSVEQSNTRLAFFTADGSRIRIVGRSAPSDSFHLPAVDRGVLLPLISLLTGLAVSRPPVVDGDGKAKYTLLAK